jgi:hypothetical protein
MTHDVMVTILPDGSVKTLRMKSSAQVIRHKKGNVRTTTIQHQRSGLPESFGDTIDGWFGGNVAKSIEYCFIMLGWRPGRVGSGPSCASETFSQVIQEERFE